MLTMLRLAMIFAVTAAAQPPAVPVPPYHSVGTRLAADLTWRQAQRDTRFQHMDRLFPVHRVRRSGRVRALLPGERLPLPAGTLEDYMQREHLAAVLVLQGDQTRAERYALGTTGATRWTTFSVTKSVTDTLAGAALRSGTIHALDDAVTRYLPEMRGSGYDGVTVRQLMTMTSGVRWNESYTTPDADNVRLYASTPLPKGDSTVNYMRQLPREATPGTRWNYNTGETDLLGVLLRRATGRSLAQQLGDTVWKLAGMQADATWIASAPGPRGVEFGGSGLSATVRDLGRYGLWVLEGGHGGVPAGWFAEADSAQVTTRYGGYGYGWWPQPDGSFAALGIFGQSILIDRRRNLVIISVGDWPEATGNEHTAARAAFWRQVQAAVDGR